MIIYFSATGNFKWVAEKIAEATGETTYSIRESLKERNRTLTIKKGDMLGLVTPTYFWQLPTVLFDWLEDTTFVLKAAITSSRWPPTVQPPAPPQISLRPSFLRKV